MKKKDAGEPRKEAGTIRRSEFLKRAAAVGVSGSAAGAILAQDASAVRSVRLTERARPFEGVTLSFAKAPFGNDETKVLDKLLAPFIASTGMTINKTVVPWNTETASYATAYAGPNPYDVSYQTNTDLTSLGTKGVLEVLNSPKWFDSPAYASQKKHFINSVVDASTYEGKLYGLPFIIGTIVMYYNKSLLQKAGITSVPSTMSELVAAGQKVTNAPAVWGFNTPMDVTDSNWYFNYQNVHDFGGDIFSKNAQQATFTTAPVVNATTYAANNILKYKIQPPLGEYNRDGGIALFTGGRLAFLLDEPLQIPVFQGQKLSFDWDFVMPVGTPQKRTVFSTTGHWVMAAKSKNQAAAWALIQYLSSPTFSKPFNEHYGFIPTRNDVDITEGSPLLKKNFGFALCCWEGMRAQPKTAQLLDAYGQALESAASGTAVSKALGTAQSTAVAALKA
jgi:multiple sugar transport system substrate-binding protein